MSSQSKAAGDMSGQVQMPQKRLASTPQQVYKTQTIWQLSSIHQAALVYCEINGLGLN